jgi:tRNA1(Val) A37 N6-methylase TrmN6
LKRYQETWIKGSSQSIDFQRECASRYEPIKVVLEKYTRPFSVIDIGANIGYFSFRIAEDFPHATVIMVENKPDLYALCMANNLQNIIMLQTHLTGDHLQAFSKY